jgi:hypothetical protein
MLLFSYIDTIPLVITTLQAVITGKVKTSFTMRSLTGRAIKIKLFTLPGSDAEKAAASNQNGMSCLEAAF